MLWTGIVSAEHMQPRMAGEVWAETKTGERPRWVPSNQGSKTP